MRTRSAAARCKLKVVAVTALLAGFVSSASVAYAQQPDNGEVPIGTFKLGAPQNGFSVVEPPAGVPERKREASDDGSGSWFFQNLESSPAAATAEDLYGDALKALDEGRTQDAQRLFERLVAEMPGSARAGEARQHLGRIYSTASEGNAARPLGTAAAPVGRPDVSRVLSRTTLQQARVSGAIDGQFLSDAGDRVFFGAGSANLGGRARGVIQAQARFLKKHPELSAAVEGYADEGALPDEETLRLSQERAAVVRDRLIAEGIDASRLVAYGRGREDPVSSCPAPECLAQNRRVVTILLDGPVNEDAPPPARRAEGQAPAGSAPTQ